MPFLIPQSVAPAFTLPDAEGKIVSLAEYIGRFVLLYFYPKDDTPGCTTEACAFRDNFPLYENLPIAVIGISRDSSASHKRFKDKYRLPFTLLSDISGETIHIYGAEKPPAGTLRISYLIGPDGTIVKVYDKVSPATHAQQVLEDLKSLNVEG